MKKTIVFLFFTLTFNIGYADNIVGRVVGVSDGDTITILDSEKKQIKIRLSEIDTPESGQPYGYKSKQELSNLIYGKTVNVNAVKKDRYGRTLGRVYLDGFDINAELIKIGAAWVYRQYSKDESLLSLESEARSKKIGLWSLHESERIPPWEWRKNNRKNQISSGNLSSSKNIKVNKHSHEIYKCGNKSRCTEMKSCNEAIFYFQVCGLIRLDGNKNGIPCANVCR